VRRPDAGLDRVQTWTVGKGGLEQRRHEPMYLSRLANCVSELGFAEDAKKRPLVLAGAELGRIDVWEASSGRSRDPLRADSQPIWQLAFDRDGAVLAAADRNGAVWLWSTANWSRKANTTPTPFELTLQLDRPPSHPGNLVIGGKGDWLAVTSDVLTFWDLDVRALHGRVCAILRDPGQHGAESPAPASTFCAPPRSR
jgi:WD40 repeat protein